MLWRHPELLKSHYSMYLFNWDAQPTPKHAINDVFLKKMQVMFFSGTITEVGEITKPGHIASRVKISRWRHFDNNLCMFLTQHKTLLLSNVKTLKNKILILLQKSKITY